MKLEVDIGNVVRLRKKHPCGGDEWEVIRLGVDIRIRCLKCQRYILLERGMFERQVRSIVSKSGKRDA